MVCERAIICNTFQVQGLQHLDGHPRSQKEEHSNTEVANGFGKHRLSRVCVEVWRGGLQAKQAQPISLGDICSVPTRSILGLFGKFYKFRFDVRE